MPALMWFRGDLRVTDNRALHAAATAHREVVAVFHDTPEQWRLHGEGPAKIDLVRRCLAHLTAALRARGIPLHVVRSDRFDAAPRLIAGLAEQVGATDLYFNAQYPVNERKRDAAVARHLRSKGVRIHRMTDAVFFAPGTLRSGSGAFYKVFTPFKRRLLSSLTVVQTEVLPAPLPLPPQPADHSRWPGGEVEAMRRLKAFASARIGAYAADRDIPGTEGTSRLSPYLAVGAISPRQCLAEARRHPGPGADAWISELIWREFNTHVLVGWPRVSRGRAFRPETEGVPWRNNPAGFAAWCEGRTGIPLVDAAMRQLKAEHWMHNRLRMVTAQFLTKNLLIDWRWGERFFMEHLIDADLANNNAGWQWSASTGTDAAPYFRVFNPISQSRRFDPDGTFLRRYLPELASIPGKAIHDPGPLLRRARKYPQAIVDLRSSRQRAIDTFKAAIAAAAPPPQAAAAP